MRKTLINSVLFMAALLPFAGAQATLIDGNVQFAAQGLFMPPSNPTSINFFQTAAECGTVCTSNLFIPPQFGGATGKIGQMVAAGGGAPDFTLMDIDLTQPLPAVEWTLGSVVANGVHGKLIYQILSGHSVDNGSSALSDLGGNGMFHFQCDDSANCNSGMEDTLGSWSISNSGGTLIVGINVPAPATIGILGCALLLFGVIRRRKRALAFV